jgi:hypothetical protein
MADADKELTAEIVLAEFVPPEARCPELYQAVDAAIVAGDALRLAAIIRATQERQQAQLDSHSQELAEIRGQLCELQKQQATTVNLYYSDCRQWHQQDNRQWHQDARRWQSPKTTTINSDWDWLLAWAAVAIVAALLAPVLCPPQQGYSRPQPALHQGGQR